ncbi:MAG: hypothetical protein ACP5JJ_14660 [Anaerolineae bacterium]
MDVEEMWGTEENLLSRGVSFAALCEGQVVAWCTPDCVDGDRIDVRFFTRSDCGILTLSPHRVVCQAGGRNGRASSRGV